MHDDLVHTAFQTVRCHLCQNGVTSGTHVGGTDHQGIEAVVIDTNLHRTHVHVGNGRALHSHGRSDSPDLPIAHVHARVFPIPSDHFLRSRHTAVQRAAVQLLAVVGRHHIAFLYHVLLPKRYRIHVKSGRKLIDG